MTLSTRDFLVGTVIFSLCAAILSLGIAVYTSNRVSYSTDAKEYTDDAIISTTPFSGHIVATTPITLSLPNDLLNYVGKTFTIYTRTAQPHVISIEVGTLDTTWDGTNKVATFGGAKGDGIVFHVLDRNRISVISNTNVNFS